MTITTTVQDLQQAINKLSKKELAGTTIEMKVCGAAIVYKTKHPQTGEMVVSVYQPVKQVNS